MSPEEWGERERTEIIATARVHERRIGDVEKDVDSLAKAQRQNFKDVGEMLDKALTQIDAACQAKVEGVEVQIKGMRREFKDALDSRDKADEKRQWTRTEKLMTSGMFLTTVASILALVLK